ncbi:MAG: hypothetical protein ACTHN0_19955, partial [Aquihabitans sp.]
MGWPTEPVNTDEPARLRSQAAVYVVCALALLIAGAATSASEIGLGCAVGLGLGVLITIAADLKRPFGSVPGAVVALVGMMAMTMLLAIVGGPSGAFALVPMVGAFVLGFDWHLVRRLRPLPFASGFLVVLGMASGDAWTYPAGVVWLALALGALTSLESDRRAAQPKVQAVNIGPEAPDVQTSDLLTTVLIALAIALVAALVLSTPSCQRSSNSSSGGGSSPGFDPGSGYGSGSGTGSGTGSGSGYGSGSGRQYVPDPNGRFLVPNDGSGSGSGSGTASDVPSPELLPPRGESRTYRLDDGTVIVAERADDGTGTITVTEPDGRTRTYTYRDQSDGTTRIHERGEGGEPGRTLTYDPNGRIASEDGTGGTSGTGSGSGPGTSSGTDGGSNADQQKDEKKPPHLDWRLIVGLVLLLAAAGALAWWWSKRPSKAPPADAPPWALQLAREIDREGAARGPRRGRSQSLVRYASDLRAGPIPDDRVTEVADTVSAALFGRQDP